MDRHYANAPIIEAVIDLRVELPAEMSLEGFKSLGNRLSDRFPIRLPIRTIEMGFQQAGESPVQFHSEQEMVGLRMQSASGDRVLQAQRAGFTFSHMAPYTSWGEFRAEARDLWPAFVEMTGAQRVTRAAIRVINNLRLPYQVIDIKDYVTLHPNLPDGLLSSLETFYMQLQISLVNLVEDCHAIINVAHRQTIEEDSSQLLLDFDLFVTKPFEADSEDIWVLLDSISTAKNSVFESCITDETRRLIL